MPISAAELLRSVDDPNSELQELQQAVHEYLQQSEWISFYRCHSISFAHFHGVDVLRHYGSCYFVLLLFRQRQRVCTSADNTLSSIEIGSRADAAHKSTGSFQQMAA